MMILSVNVTAPVQEAFHVEVMGVSRFADRLEIRACGATNTAIYTQDDHPDLTWQLFTDNMTPVTLLQSFARKWG